MTLRIGMTLTRPGGFRLDVDLTLPARGCTTVQGPSGSGKTTLLRCVAGLERAARGRLAVGDRVLQDDDAGVATPAHRRGLGYVFQQGALFPHLDVRGNLDFARRHGRHGAPDITGALRDALDLDPLLDRTVGALSGGERQRVALARALVAGPSLLLLDEPLSSVDPAARRAILAQLERVIRTLDIPVLHVTHDAAEAARLADHLVVLDRGGVAAHGPLDEVLTSPAPGLGAGPDAAAVVTATVTSRDPHDELATLDFAGGRLLVPDPGLPVSAPVRVRILARDVSLAASRADDSSILNLLPVRVLDLAPDGPSRRMVRVQAGATVLLAAVTRRSADALALAPGRQLHAQIKSLALL